MCVQYIGGISWVHRVTFSKSVGYHEYMGGGGGVVDRGMLSASKGYHDACGGYHEYIGGCSVHEDFQCKPKAFLKLFPWYPLMYSWYPFDVLTTLDVLMISPTWIMVSSDVLNIPQCTHDIFPMYSWYPPDALNISRCTEHTLYRVFTRVRFTGHDSNRFQYWVILSMCNDISRRISYQILTLIPIDDNAKDGRTEVVWLFVFLPWSSACLT